MRLITATAVLLCGNSNLPLTNAKNYGPTKPEECDAQDGTGCADDSNANAAPSSSTTNKSSLMNKFQHLTKSKTDDDDDDDSGDDDDDDFSLPHGQCGLYLAPSSLPYAGLGLFSGAPVPFDYSINEYIGGTFPGYNDDKDPPLWTDMFIPIADKYKALPYRGQQRFPSWLAYIWPESPGALSDFVEASSKPFPVVPPELWEFDQGLDRANGIEFYMDDLNDMLFEMLPSFEPSEKVSAFVPGLASLANHGHGDISNIDRIYKNSRADYNGQEAPWHAGVGAFTPHHKIEFSATRDIVEGMELLIDYGESFNQKNMNKLKHVKKTEKKRARDKDGSSDMRQKKGFAEGIHKKWDQMDDKEIGDSLPDELPTEKAKRDNLAKGIASDSSEFKDGEQPYSEYRKNNFLPWEKDGYDDDDDGIKDEDIEVNNETLEDIIKPLPYLAKNGVCLSSGKVRVQSSPIQYAGRGLFSTTHFGKNDVVVTSPLIAMRHEDFVIYKSDSNQEFVRNVLDKSKVVGLELLYNYAFSHPDSPLYLVPTAPLANFINHGGPKDSDKPNAAGANVQVRWPRTGSNSAKLFEWAYNQKHGNHFDNDFESKVFNNPNPWLKDHPIDVMERSNKLALEYVALRDIHNGEEILLDYGPIWDELWKEFGDRHPYARSGYFRQSIDVPDGLYPEKWMNVSDVYEIAEIQDLENKPLEVGVAVPMTWAHNGKPVASKYAYVVGLEKGFSDKFLEYSEERGIIELYRRLLTEQEGFHLPSDGFDVYKPGTLTNNTSELDRAMEFFAHRYHSDQWNFNMHFVAAWDETARKDVMKALGDAGFDIAVKGIGERFGYDNMTCFHGSYMGVTHCDKSKMHTDIYATEDKSWNIVFPLITVEGTAPELDIMSEDINTAIGVHYLKDVAYAIGDFGYHQTRPIAYFDPEDDSHGNIETNGHGVPIRVVFGAYCSQIDETNVAMIRHIYDGDDPAPFADQFKDVPMREIHWDSSGTSTLANPSGEGYV